MKTWKPFAIAAVFLLLLTSRIHAQTGRVSGRVLDPSGAVIVSADLKAFQGSVLINETKTDERGTFALELAPGQYRLEVSAPDFKKLQQTVRVTPTTPPLTISMLLATVDTTVQVETKSDDVSIETDANLTSTTIAGDSVKDLPEDEDAMMAQLQALASGAGAADATATFVVDGFANGRVPPRDQIQQIIIDTNVFSAENVGGGPRIQIITKPGTGPWSGNAFYSFNNQDLNARNPFDATRLDKQQRIITTSYGGPVIPGKLSLRLNLRDLHQDFQGASVIAVTPSGPVQQGIFSPSINENANLTGQLFLTTNNTFNFSVAYNTNANKKTGAGGVTLAERASNFKGHNVNFQLTERAIISPKFISELRLNYFHNQNSFLPVTEAYAIDVLDAFNGGGGQFRQRRRGTTYNFGNIFRWTVTPYLNMQIGTDIFYNDQYSNLESNYLGEFVFSSLGDYLKGHPIRFTRTTGNPVLDLTQWEGAAFVQTDWKVNPKLNLGVGVRYQAQTNLRDYSHPAPALQAAYQPRPGTVIRAGGRISYQAFNIFDLETIKREDGLNHQVETVIQSPTYPDPFEGGVTPTPTPDTATIRTREPHLRAPYTINSAVTLEQSITKGWRFSATLDVTRGVHLFRTRNINAPYPGTPLSLDLFSALNSSDPAVQAAARNQVDRMRPLYPRTGNVYQYESSADSFSRNIGGRLYLPTNFVVHGIGITGFAQYTFGWAFDNASSENQYNWRADWAVSGRDIRHRFLSNLTVTLPKSMSASFLTIANSGRPYSITTGQDNNGDLATNDRPAGVQRNSLRGPGFYNVNMSFTKTIALKRTEGSRGGSAGPAGPLPGAPPVFVGGPGGPTVISPQSGSSAPGPKLSFNANVTNLFNNTQLRSYSGVLTSPLFGKPISTAPGRVMMLGFSMSF